MMINRKRDKTPDNSITRMPRTLESTVFELLTLMLIIVLWAVAVLAYSHAPEVIPVHFDVKGNANGYESPVSLLMVAAIGTLISGLMLAAAYAPKQKSKMGSTINNYAQMVVVARMLRVMAVLLVTLFICIEVMMSQPDARIPKILTVVLVALIMATPIAGAIAVSCKR